MVTAVQLGLAASPEHFSESQEIENQALEGLISGATADALKGQNLIARDFNPAIAAMGAYPYQIGQEVFRDVRDQGISGLWSGLQTGAQAGYDNLRGIGAGLYDKFNPEQMIEPSVSERPRGEDFGMTAAPGGYDSWYSSGGSEYDDYMRAVAEWEAGQSPNVVQDALRGEATQIEEQMSRSISEALANQIPIGDVPGAYQVAQADFLINRAISDKPEGGIGSDDPHDIYNIRTQYGTPATAVGAYPSQNYGTAGIEVPTTASPTREVPRTLPVNPISQLMTTGAILANEWPKFKEDISSGLEEFAPQGWQLNLPPVIRKGVDWIKDLTSAETAALGAGTVVPIRPPTSSYPVPDDRMKTGDEYRREEGRPKLVKNGGGSGKTTKALGKILKGSGALGAIASALAPSELDVDQSSALTKDMVISTPGWKPGDPIFREDGTVRAGDTTFADQVAEERYGVQRYGAGRDFINQQYAEEPDYNVQDQMAQWYEQAFIDPDEYGWTRPTIEQRQEAIRGVQDAPEGFWGALQDRIANLIPGAEASVARDVEFEREQREPTWFPPTTSSGSVMVTDPIPTVEPSPFIGDEAFVPSFAEGGYTIAPSGPVVGDEEEEVSEERVKVIKKKPKEKRTSVEEQVVVASAVKKALSNASKGKKVKKELKAIVELAKVDPTIVKRYTTVGSQELQDITSGVDSFARMPKKKKAKPGYGKPPTRPGGR